METFSTLLAICEDHNKVPHHWPYLRDSPHKGPVMQQSFPCHDVTMSYPIVLYITVPSVFKTMWFQHAIAQQTTIQVTKRNDLIAKNVHFLVSWCQKSVCPLFLCQNIKSLYILGRVHFIHRCERSLKYKRGIISMGHWYPDQSLKS